MVPPHGVTLRSDGFDVALEPAWHEPAFRALSQVLLWLAGVWVLALLVTLLGLGLWSRELVGVGAAGMAGSMGVGWALGMALLAAAQPGPRLQLFVQHGELRLGERRWALPVAMRREGGVVYVEERSVGRGSDAVAGWVVEAVSGLPSQHGSCAAPGRSTSPDRDRRDRSAAADRAAALAHQARTR